MLWSDTPTASRLVYARVPAADMWWRVVPAEYKKNYREVLGPILESVHRKFTQSDRTPLWVLARTAKPKFTIVLMVAMGSEHSTRFSQIDSRPGYGTVGYCFAEDSPGLIPPLSLLKARRREWFSSLYEEAMERDWFRTDAAELANPRFAKAGPPPWQSIEGRTADEHWEQARTMPVNRAEGAFLFVRVAGGGNRLHETVDTPLMPSHDELQAHGAGPVGRPRTSDRDRGTPPSDEEIADLRANVPPDLGKAPGQEEIQADDPKGRAKW
ncbi:MAG: hypothetical protein ABW224_16180 [Kibdelosporangium sp.]